MRIAHAPPGACVSRRNHKKTDVVKYAEVFHHVGFLVNGSSAFTEDLLAGCPTTWQ